MTADRVAAWLVTAALLGIVAQGQAGRRSIAARVAALAGRGVARPRRIVGWAAGTFVTYGLSALAALLVLGRGGVLVLLPAELADAAGVLGIAPGADGAGMMLASLGLGGAIGIGALLLWRWSGRTIGWGYRSPAAARGPGERGAAALLALSAGVSEEVFFRLSLPLSVTVACGSGVAGLAAATLAFGLAHRHQGVAGMLATALIGAGLGYAYLATGALWVAIVLHVAVDLHALVLRPWIERLGDQRPKV